jgi:hypothetical protein
MYKKKSGDVRGFECDASDLFSKRPACIDSQCQDLLLQETREFTFGACLSPSSAVADEMSCEKRIYLPLRVHTLAIGDKNFKATI